MKSKRIGYALSTIVALLVVAIASSAIASSSAFSFTMFLRVVRGDRNKMLHSLDAGELTISGEVETTGSVASPATKKPVAVSFEVRQKGTILSSSVCSASVTPDPALSKKVSFSKSCGKIGKGIYYIIVSKDYQAKTGDGWHITGSGTLVTRP